MQNLSQAAAARGAATTTEAAAEEEEESGTPLNGKQGQPPSSSSPAAAAAGVPVPGQSTCSGDDGGPPPFAFTFGSPTVSTTAVGGGTGPPPRPARPPRFAFGAAARQEGQEEGASAGSFSAQVFMQQQRGNQRKLGEFEVSFSFFCMFGPGLRFWPAFVFRCLTSYIFTPVMVLLSAPTRPLLPVLLFASEPAPFSGKKLKKRAGAFSLLPPSFFLRRLVRMCVLSIEGPQESRN